MYRRLPTANVLDVRCWRNNITIFRFAFEQADGVRPFDLAVDQMFGSSPKTYMVDKTVERHYENVSYDTAKLNEYIRQVLQLEAVACKDWLTNKVDRSVTGKIARQQC